MASTDGSTTENWHGIFQFPVHAEYGRQFAGGLITDLSISLNGSLWLSGSNLTLDAWTRYQDLNSGNGGKLANWLNFDDTITGSAGNDVIMGYGGSDRIDGGDGIDIAVYAGKSTDYEGTKGNGINTVKDIRAISNHEGFDTLTNVERLHFQGDNVNIALDAHGKQSVALLGAILPSQIKNPGLRGDLIELLDAGLDVKALCQKLVEAHIVENLVGSADNRALANYVFKNVTGSSTDAPTDLAGQLTSYINEHGQADFIATITGLAINVPDALGYFYA